MAVLAAMVSIALDMVIRVSASFWMTALVNKFPLMGASSDGMTSQAMQQGGMGLILTTLILTAPQWAAMFFQGTLGSFMAYSQIGGSPVAQAPGPNGQPGRRRRRTAVVRTQQVEPQGLALDIRSWAATMRVKVRSSR